MKTDKKTKSGLDVHHLPIQVASLFDDPGEWVIVNFAYWKTNTQNDRRWILRREFLLDETPIKAFGTLSRALDRLFEKRLIEKIPFGEPQQRKCGKHRQDIQVIQSYQYIFDANQFDAVLRSFVKARHLELYRELSEMDRATYPQWIADLSKTDSPPIAKWIALCSKMDSTIKNRNRNRTKRVKPVIKNQEGNWNIENPAEGKIHCEVSKALGSLGPSEQEETTNDNFQNGQNTAGNGNGVVQKLNGVPQESTTTNKPGTEQYKNPHPSMAPGPKPEKDTNSKPFQKTRKEQIEASARDYTKSLTSKCR